MRDDRGNFTFYVQTADRPLYYAAVKLAKKKKLPESKIISEALRKYFAFNDIQVEEK